VSLIAPRHPPPDVNISLFSPHPIPSVSNIKLLLSVSPMVTSSWSAIL